MTQQDELSERMKAELLDSIDEELELELDDERLSGPQTIADNGTEADSIKRRTYFKELFRLQRELVKLQDWVVKEKLKVVVIFEGRDAAGKAASSSASPSVSIPASAASPHFPRPTSASARNGISSAMSAIFQRRARSSCSTAAGTIAPASSG